MKINQHTKLVLNKEFLFGILCDYIDYIEEKRGVILNIPDNDWLHDILLINCNLENAIITDDLYESFCEVVYNMDINKVNKKIEELFLGN